MRLDTTIVRTPFGFTASALAAEWYGQNVYEFEREKRRVRHLEDVAATAARLPGGPLGSVSGFHKERDDADGIEAEWWTVLAFDREGRFG